MSVHCWRVIVLVLLLAGIAACGDGRAPSPTSPSAPSFLAGTWRGTLIIQRNPGDPDRPPAAEGSTTWTFEVVPDTNHQTFRATIRAEHAWLPLDVVATTAIVPGNTPPAQISTIADYDSPRGCRGSFASLGVAEATEIDADFSGADCGGVTFSGRVRLTKE